MPVPDGWPLAGSSWETFIPLLRVTNLHAITAHVPVPVPRQGGTLLVEAVWFSTSAQVTEDGAAGEGGKESSRG